MNLNTRTYRTNDLYFASFLKTVGCLLVEIQEERGKKFFVFNDESGLISKIQIEFVNGATKIVAKDFINNIRDLKTLINMGC